MNVRDITIVVPVYNEQDSLEILLREIHEVAGTRGYRVRIVFVDDGSTDDSWPVIRRLAEEDSAVGGVRFRGNRGKAAALMAGFAVARGELVITMDADLQDPPQEIPRLIEHIDAGFDVVSGWKRHRLDPWHKVYPSHVFNRLISRLTGVDLHDHVCGLKCYRRKVVSDLRIYGEQHRFLGVLAAAKGYRITEVPTLHRRRTTGVGKYGFSRFAKGFLDLLTVLALTRFRWRPQHMIGVLGLWTIVALLPLFAVILLLQRYVPVAAFPLTVLLTTGLLGCMLIAIGLVGELIVADRPLTDLYEVTERTGWCAHREPSKTLDPVAIPDDDTV